MNPAAAVLSSRDLVSLQDGEETLRLFATLLDEAEIARARSDRASIMIPGPFWLLARQNPRLEDLRSYLDGVLPPLWPAWFKRNLEGIQQDILTPAFRSCARASWLPAELAGRNACRIMAAVAQTLCSTNIEIVRRNRTLARTYDSWNDPRRFAFERPDEQGGYVGSGNLKLWMASHVGPRTADKIENQDAVCAMATPSGIVFALADGVSTSMGSRFAAAQAAQRFCAEAKQVLMGVAASEALLIDAARRTQRALEESLDRILADPSGPEMNAIAGPTIQPSLVSALLHNTQTAEKSFLPPALATTLIGGVMDRPTATGKSHVHIIAIGDGAVECIREDGSVDQLMATDPEIMEIQGSLGPGPLSRDTLEHGPLKTLECTLGSRDLLLITSDGLTRGHRDPVYTLAAKLIGDFKPRLTRANKAIARELLQDLASAAEERYPAVQLFEDNLSLIVVGAD